jgi:hypothetical protein
VAESEQHTSPSYKAFCTVVVNARESQQGETGKLKAQTLLKTGRRRGGGADVFARLVTAADRGFELIGNAALEVALMKKQAI